MMGSDTQNIPNSSSDLNKLDQEALAILRAVRDDVAGCSVSLYFVVKRSNNGYNSFAPEVSSVLQSKIIDLVLQNVITALEQDVVTYNALGVSDEEIELLHQTQVDSVNTFLESINNDNLFYDMKELNVSKINFYVIVITYNGQTIYLFRQFTKMSKLRKGFILQIFDNALREMDSDFLGLDPFTDMVLLKNSLFILNHISLERIFNYRDQYLKNTEQALGAILTQDVMENIQQFADDCKSDVRIMKRFTNMMSQERLPLFFENFDKVPEIVHTLGLDIDFTDDGKMIYREKSQLFHIVQLMSDAYFQSLLANRYGVAKIEESI